MRTHNREPIPVTRPSGRSPRSARKRSLGAEGLESRIVCSGFHATEGLAPASVYQASGVRAASTGYTRLANQVYTSAKSSTQVLDVYRPTGTPPPGGWPVVLAIHGGGWRRFSKAEYAAKVVPTITAHGYAVVAPNYSLSHPGAPSWPAPLLELRQAVQWVHTNAQTLGLDASKIAAMGESAGGQLALLLGTDPAGPDTKVRAVVDFYGPSDLGRLLVESPVTRPAVDQFLGSGADATTVRDASPVSHVAPGDPPVFIIQGTADNIIPSSQSIVLAIALTAARVPNTLHFVSGAGHGFGLYADPSILPTLLGFLENSLGRTTTSP